MPISRVLIISFIKLVTVTGNLLGTALGLAAAHGDTAEHSLSVLSSVAGACRAAARHCFAIGAVAWRPGR